MPRKPIKRNEYIKKVSQEHHFNLLFCWKVRKGLEKGTKTERVRRYAEYFWKHHLQLHFHNEERILFALVKDRQVKKAIQEHKEIKTLLEQLKEYPEEKLRFKLAELADKVYEHVRYEERHLFPHLEREFTQEQVDELVRRADKHDRLVLPDQYEDQFWNTN
jgi:iron-sulfur cluster repair protein YtfE (RIC family)